MQLAVKDFFRYTVTERTCGDFKGATAICLCKTAYIAENIAKGLARDNGGYKAFNVIETVVEAKDMDSRFLRHGFDDAVVPYDPKELFPKWRYWQPHDEYVSGNEDYTKDWKEVE